MEELKKEEGKKKGRKKCLSVKKKNVTLPVVSFPPPCLQLVIHLFTPSVLTFSLLIHKNGLKAQISSIYV